MQVGRIGFREEFVQGLPSGKIGVHIERFLRCRPEQGGCHERNRGKPAAIPCKSGLLTTLAHYRATET
jgi:hypothetical protein